MQVPNDALTSPDRLAAIVASDILEAGVLPVLDRVVRIAAGLLDVPVAQLNVITADQQIPVSHFGGDAWGTAVGLDRSYCQHIVQSGEPLVVEDARRHPLLRDSPATGESGVVAYLSVPIVSPRAGFPIATLCGVDFRPRRWTEEDIARLNDMAALALSEIELRASHVLAEARSERALRETEARLRHALDVAALGAWDLSLAGGGTWRALRHDQIFGYPAGRADWTYDDFLDHVHPGDRAWVDERFRAAVASRGAWDFTCRIRRADDGAERWISARGEVVADAEGRPERMTGVVRDVTDQQLTEQALREARDAAEAANRAKSEFLAVMSHELRTPLNAIGGYAELLEMGIRGPVNTEQVEDLRRIQQSQRHLLGLINEVLNYAKLETGTVHFDIADVHLRDVLTAVEGLVAPQVRAKRLELRFAECGPGVRVRADAEKLRQILVNLLSNAIKFTGADGRIDVSWEERDGRVRIAVRDTGIGIPAEKLEAIFEPFVQVRSGLTRTAEGTGLGLAISRDLARALGGDLVAESGSGGGSVFILTLPAPTPE